MGLRIFSVVGEALNFGGRRMETIARVAWLPLVLSMISNMVTVFAMLSVALGRVITFKDVSSFALAQQALAKLFTEGFANHAQAMWIIVAASMLVQTILSASFMAPLIRYAGLGEKPAPGFMRLPFGADQLRFIISGVLSSLFVILFIVSPILIASFYALNYIFEALIQTVAVFPDPNSLHTIEVKAAGATIAERGLAWMYHAAVPIMLVAPFGLILWLILFLHFAPKNRPGAASRDNPALRAAVTLLAASPVIIGLYLLMRMTVMSSYEDIAKLSGEAARNLTATPVDSIAIFAIMAALIAAYFNLRLVPYQGVAVCRKSLGLGNTFAVTRGWNFFKLLLALILLTLLLAFIQTVFVNLLLLQLFLPWIANLLYEATVVSTKLVNSGVAAEWVRPLFVWIWAMVQILVNLIWLFFSYGVIAGLYGRLYRESEAGH